MRKTVMSSDYEITDEQKEFVALDNRMCGCGTWGDALETAVKAVAQMQASDDCIAWQLIQLDLQVQILSNVEWAKALSKEPESIHDNPEELKALRESVGLLRERAEYTAMIFTAVHEKLIAERINGPILKAFLSTRGGSSH